ncbi:MAG: FtsH protease activity modulator HflK [Gammaproteobacteria bacterium]|nr:FtsH protease activity modulator HflK [Gammaproteobacteria bacterium]
MPWNQSGSNGNDKDPWGQQNQNWGRRGRKPQQGPPELDEIAQQIWSRFKGFGGRKSGDGDSGGGRGDDGGERRRGGGLGKYPILVLLIVGLGFWIFTGFYTVDQGEQAIELRFGKFSETNGAGLHWHMPSPIEVVEIINTQKENTVQVGYRDAGRGKQDVPKEALMLTEDENIIHIQLAVQYDIKDPTNLLFHVSEYNQENLADGVVRQAAESAIREIVGRSSMDFAITEGRAQLASETKSLVQEILDRYETGINIVTVEMQDAQPPEQVQDAFADVVRAREDEERFKNLAEAYANDIIPKARGFAARIIEEAEAYRAAVIARSEGETARFNKVLDEYWKAPDVTRERLYIEAMQQVFSNTSKLLIDQPEGGNSVMYLPLEQLLRSQRSGSTDTLNSPQSSRTSGSAMGDTQSTGLRSTTRTSR